MANLWRLYTTIIPSISGYEVNRGYIVNNTLLVINSISGGQLVSKIYSDANSSIYYVDTAAVSAYISNGIFNPNLVIEPVLYSMDFSNSQNSGYVATMFI